MVLTSPPGNAMAISAPDKLTRALDVIVEAVSRVTTWVRRLARGPACRGVWPAPCPGRQQYQDDDNHRASPDSGTISGNMPAWTGRCDEGISIVLKPDLVIARKFFWGSITCQKLPYLFHLTFAVTFCLLPVCLIADAYCHPWLC